MFLIGILLTVVGIAAAAAMNFMAEAPAVLSKMPGEMLGWVAVALLGVVLMFLGRRPGD